MDHAWGVPTPRVLIAFPRALPWHLASSEHRWWGHPHCTARDPLPDPSSPPSLRQPPWQRLGVFPALGAICYSETAQSFDFQSDFRPKVPSLPAGTPQVPARGFPPDKTLPSYSEKQPDCAYLSQSEGFMLGKDVFWEHSVSGLSVTNPRPPAGRGYPTPQAEREGCWQCLARQM